MRQILATLFVLIVTVKTASGQITSFGFQEGTITKKDGSIMKGYVEFAVTYYSKVAFKKTADGKEISIKSGDIKAIQTPYKYIENITLDDKERLMGLVSDGRVKLFSHVTINPGETKQGQGGTYRFNAAPTIIYALVKDGIFSELRKKDFKTKLAALLIDQSLLVERINFDEVKFEEIESIVSEYNNIHKTDSLRRQITVKVIDAETKKPIKDARVTISGTSIVTTTNFLGFMQIAIDTVDTLLIDHPEYETGQIKVPSVDNFQITLTRISPTKD